jgi:hypothetical protein
MDLQDRTWMISLRSRRDQQHVQAATVRGDDGELVFRDAQDNLKGICCLTDVQGYSVAPSARGTTKPRVTIIDVTRGDPSRPTSDEEPIDIWEVWVRSKKDPHCVEAADVKKDGDKLIFTDFHGNLTGCFCRTEVESYLVAPIAVRTGITIIIDGAPGEPLPARGF